MIRDARPLRRCASALVFFASALAGCGADVADVSTAQIALRATSTDPTLAAVGDESAQLNVEAAWLSLRSLELTPCAADQASIGLRDYGLDLAQEPPALALFDTNLLEYCGVRLELGPQTRSEPALLEGATLLVHGTRADGVPLELRSELDLTLELGGEGTPFDASFLVLAFDLARWFQTADVAAATESDGVAHIDRDSNPELLAAFEAATESAAALHLDTDGDAILDPNETEPIAVAR